MNTMQQLINATMGTWTDGSHTLHACHYDVGSVRLQSSTGATLVESERAWLERLDALKERGWHKA